MKESTSEMKQLNRPAGVVSFTGKIPWVVLLGVGLLNLGRGGFHWLAPDSGAGSVAGMNLDYPNRDDVTFLLATAGFFRYSLASCTFSLLPENAPLFLWFWNW